MHERITSGLGPFGRPRLSSLTWRRILGPAYFVMAESATSIS